MDTRNTNTSAFVGTPNLDSDSTDREQQPSAWQGSVEAKRSSETVRPQASSAPKLSAPASFGLNCTTSRMAPAAVDGESAAAPSCSASFKSSSGERTTGPKERAAERRNIANRVSSMVHTLNSLHGASCESMKGTFRGTFSSRLPAIPAFGGGSRAQHAHDANTSTGRPASDS
eukprot:2333688-Pleurochrysis_carterae.AAC.1